MVMSKELFEAAKTDNLDLAITALNKMGNRNEIDAPNQDGETALIVAAKFRAGKVVRILLNSLANVNLTDHMSRTALHWAVIREVKDIIQSLLGSMALTDMLDIDGNTPIMLIKNNDRELKEIFYKLEVTNYHADHLALRRDIESLLDDRDIINESLNWLSDYIKKSSDDGFKPKLINLTQYLLPPEETFGFLRKEVISKLEIEPKRSSLQEGSRSSSKGSKKNDSNNIEDYLDTELTSKSFLFEKINKLVSVMDQILNEIQSSPNNKSYLEIGRLLDSLRRFYLDYVDQVCSSKGESRRELLLGRICVTGYFGSRYLRPEVALRFLPFFQSHNKKNNQQTRDNKYGLHSVIRLFHAHYKIKPTAPFVESMYDFLNKIMSGQGSPPTELLFFERGYQIYSVLASKTVYGENLQDLLTEKPHYASLIENYTSHVVMSIVADPDDAKFDNYMARMKTDKTGKITVWIEGIDNDLAFSYKILTFPGKSSFTGKHYVKMKSSILLLKNIEGMVDPQYAQIFFRQPPVLIMMEWLKMLHIRNRSYSTNNISLMTRKLENLNAKNREELLMQELNSINLPAKLLPNTLINVYSNLQKVWNAIKRNPKITHHDLVMAVDPIIGAYYKFLRDQKCEPETVIENVKGKKKTVTYPEIILRQVNLYNAPILEEIMPGIEKEISIYTKTEADIEKGRTEPFELACENFINSLDYKKFDNSFLEIEVIERLSRDFSFIENLVIRNSLALTDHRLEVISQSLNNLKTITLSNCLNIKGHGLSALLCYLPEIIIHIENMGQLSVICFLDLLQHHEKVKITLEGKSYSLSFNKVDLLSHAVSQKECYNLVLALLMRGVHLSGSQKFPPLHLAARAGLPEVVNELIRYGVSLDSVPQGIMKSPLDISCEEYIKASDLNKRLDHKDIITTFLSSGMLQCGEPENVLKVLLDIHSKNKFLANSLLTKQIFDFAHYHNLLTTELINKLVQTGLKSLDLSVPNHLRSGSHHFTLEMVRSLKSKLPTLQHLDVRGCVILSCDVLKEVLTWGLDSLTMSFDQLERCKLIKLTKLTRSLNVKLADILFSNGYINHHEFTSVSRNTEVRVNIVTDLRLNNRHLGQDILKAVNLFLTQTDELAYLDLSNSQITADSLRILTTGFNANKYIKTLLLTENPLNDGIDMVFETLSDHRTRGLKNLKELFLDNVGATSRIATLIGQVLLQHASLETLSLSNNDLNDEGVIAIAEALRTRIDTEKLSIIRHLMLSRVNMRDKGAFALGKALTFYSGIFTLDISANRQVSNLGLTAFIEFLRLNQTVQTFKCDDFATDLSLGTDFKLMAQLKVIVKEKESSVQLNRLEKVAKASQFRQQYHFPEMLSKAEESKAHTVQIESMHKRIQELEEQVKQLKRATGVPEELLLEGKREDKMYDAPSKPTKSIIGQARGSSSPSIPDIGSLKTPDFENRVRQSLLKLTTSGYQFFYSIDNNNIVIDVIGELEQNTELLNVFWNSLISSLDNINLDQKVKQNDTLLLKNLTEQQAQELLKRLKNLGIFSVDPLSSQSFTSSL